MSSESSQSGEETDIFSPDKRSELMAKIGPKDSEPELLLRSLLHRKGFRFRLHQKDLPGTPDLVLKKYDSVIFMHGCYWHRHDCPSGNSVPKTRTEFWKEKFERNIERDRKNRADLKELGWKVIIVWECEIESEPFETVKNVIRELTS